MKKPLLILSFFSLLFAFSACDDNDDEIDDLQAQIDNLSSQQGGTSALLQTGQPISVTFNSNRGFDSAAFSYSTVYNFAWDDPTDANSVNNNGNGTFNFYIDRYSLVEGSNQAVIEIDNFNPATGINNATIHVYAQDYFQQSDTSAALYVFQHGYLNTGPTNNITVNSFSYNESTRAFSINLTVNATEATPVNSTSNPATVTFSFSGTLTNSNTVQKQSYGDFN